MRILVNCKLPQLRDAEMQLILLMRNRTIDR